MHEVKISRHQFLKTRWSPYPDAIGLKTMGRVLAIHPRHLILSSTKDRLRSIKVNFKSISSKIDWSSILVVGDIIGIQKNECLLLAPYLLDEAWELGEMPSKVHHQQLWNHFMRAVAAFFNTRGFLAVTTPSLVTNPGPEPTIDAFKTNFKSGRSSHDKFLITSPELHLKKIVSQTLLPVYEMTKVFRNNEQSPRHQPEFWMIEWYRPFATLDDIASDVRNLILYLLKTLRLKAKKPKFEVTTFKKILNERHGFNFSPGTSEAQLKEWLASKKIYYKEPMSLDDLFTLVNLELVEPELNSKNVVFLGEYPPYAAALAKLNSEGWAQRFEVYWRDLELGNAFYELNDPQIQEQRFIDDNIKKRVHGLEPLPLDEDFLKSLRQGLPPTAGISVGLERLFMALFQETDIKNTKWFPIT